MVDGGVGAAFPVIFYDGEREINIGNIRVQPMLEFKIFQKMIADGIGISPNQISIYIVNHGSSQEERRKIPITGKVNFSFIIRQKDCFFLVILKRSRRYRSRKSRPSGIDYGDFSYDADFLPTSPENVILLRRDMPEFNMNGLQMDGYAKPFYQQVSQLGLGGRTDRLQDVKLRGENYRMSMAEPVNLVGPNFSLSGAAKLNPNLDPDSFPRIEETMTKDAKESGRKQVFCVECLNAKEGGSSASFHACANDPPIERFRTRAGPVARPVKKAFR